MFEYSNREIDKNMLKIAEIELHANQLRNGTAGPHYHSCIFTVSVT